MSGKTKKNKVRLNVIDVLIIILVVALLATVGYRVYTGISSKTYASTGKYVITFECDGEYNSTIKYLSKNEAVYFAGNGELLGRIYLPADKTSAIYEIKPEKQEDAKKGTSYELIDFGGYILMNNEAVKASSGGYYSIGEMNVSVGSTIDVYTNDTEFTVTVKSISAK